MFQSLSNLFSPAAYLNPWSVLAGLLLISAPIIIHLINRMRYKRIRWGAMEFLLKAQKKMKRKMIIEQLLLLILRCLLMLLAGLLIGRFFGFDGSGEESKSTIHMVILDDSPSMADAFKDDERGGADTNAFNKAKTILTERIMKAAAEATTPQEMTVYRASDVANPQPVGRINSTTINDTTNWLGQYNEPSTVRTNLAVLMKNIGTTLQNSGNAETARVLHVLSDFRSADWAEQGEAIQTQVKELAKGNIKVHFIDVAHPYRKADKTLPLAHDNIGIVEFKPMKAVIAKYETNEFTLKIRNFGVAEVKDVKVSIRVNGDEFKGGRSLTIPSLPPGQTITEKFELNLDRSGGGGNPFEGIPGTDSLKPEQKADVKKAFERYNLITAVLDSPEPGLKADNVRHTCVMVRDQLPILVIDGEPDKRDRREGSSLYLKNFIGVAGGSYLWTPGESATLNSADLSKYSFVMLLNVPSLTEQAVKNLETYVANGGGCGIWLGPLLTSDKQELYNKLLYRDGNGMLPAPLPKKVFPDKDPNSLSPDEREKYETDLMKKKLNIFQKKILVRDPAARTHPALSGLYTDSRGQVRDPDELERFYRFVSVTGYVPIERIGKWVEDKSVTELYCLMNDDKLDDKPITPLLTELNTVIADPDFAKFKDALGKAQTGILTTLRGAEVTTGQIAELFDRLLSDQTNAGDADEALYREFWSDSRNNDLRLKFARQRDKLKYGYPLYLAKQFGRGRVTMMTTTAGEAWTDWPSERPGSVSYTPVMKELVNYLAGGGVDDNQTTGQPIDVTADGDSYEPKVLTGFITHAAKPGEQVAVGGDNDPAPITVADQFDRLKEETVSEKVKERDADGKEVERVITRKILRFNQTSTEKPGVYLYGLEQRRPKPGSPNETVTSPEYRFVPVNIDSAVEGDLRRASTDDILGDTKAGLHSPEDRGWIEDLKNKKSDLSEMGWLFLLMVVVLVVEQALAVKLSYHMGNDLSDAPTVAAAMRQAGA